MDNKIDQLKDWLRALGRFINVSEFAKIDREELDVEQGEERISITIFTNDYSYHIRGRDVYNEDGYLGAVMSSRKPKAGESWTRGRDLADGPFTKRTWEKIKDDIIGCELIPLEIDDSQKEKVPEEQEPRIVENV